MIPPSDAVRFSLIVVANGIAERLALGHGGADVLEREDHAEEEEEAGDAGEPDGGEDAARRLPAGFDVSSPNVPAVSKP